METVGAEGKSFVPVIDHGDDIDRNVAGCGMFFQISQKIPRVLSLQEDVQDDRFWAKRVNRLPSFRNIIRGDDLKLGAFEIFLVNEQSLAIVLDDENGHLVRLEFALDLGNGDHLGLALERNGDHDGECRAAPYLASDINISPKQLGQLAGERQAQSRTFGDLLQLTFNLCPLLENAFLVFFGNSDSRIGDGKRNRAIVAARY